MSRLSTGDLAPLFRLPALNGQDFDLQQFSGRPVVLVFSRYAGCAVCRMGTAHLIDASKRFKDRDLVLAMISQSPVSSLDAYFADRTPDFHVLSDVDAAVYAQYGAQTNFWGFLSVGSLTCAVTAIRGGHRHGRFEGRETQMTAEFVIGRNGQIEFAHYGRFVGDVTDPEQLLGRADLQSEGSGS